MSSAAENMNRAVNRLAKWRTVFAGWQLGTRPKGEPESDAVRDHRESTLLQRVELSALATLLIQKGIIDCDEYRDQIAVEAEHLSRMLSKKFPGFEATDDGMSIDVQTAAKTTQGWKP